MTSTRTKIAAGVMGLAATLGACSSSPSADGPTTTSPASTTPSTAAGVTTSTAGEPSSAPSTTTAQTVPTLAPANTLPKGACATGQLSVVLGADGAAAGTRYYPIVFTNVSPTSCTITGSPGVSLVDGSRTQLGDPAGNTGSTGASTVTLAPGAKASALLGVGTAELVSGCVIATSTDVRVYPPGNTDPVFVPLATKVCTAPGTTLETVQPVVAGDTGMLAPG